MKGLGAPIAGMDKNEVKTALVTGANRGLGLAISRALATHGLRVVTAARDPARARVAARQLSADGGEAIPVALDVREPASIANALAEVAGQGHTVDVLVNNAGILIDGPEDILAMVPETLHTTLETNLNGPLLLAQAVLPGMCRRGYGRVVNMSSTLGTLADITDPDSPHGMVDSPAYRLSKGGLNLLTALLARAVDVPDVLINAACPGWVRTEMGSDRAPLSVEEGADTPVWLATLPADGPTGGLFRQRRAIPW
jgi:NAD(P)-dependent dehydrogenase (short-subunit alcohol dehydrogenase family)